MKNTIIRPAYLPPLVAYRIAVIVLLAALLMVATGARQELAVSRHQTQMTQETLEQTRELLLKVNARAQAAESRLDAIDRSQNGDNIAQGTRKGIVAEGMLAD